MNNDTITKQKINNVLTRYHIKDRQVAITPKGVMVYVPANCADEKYEDMYEDIRETLNDETDVVIFHTKDSTTVHEFIDKNKEMLRKNGWI